LRIGEAQNAARPPQDVQVFGELSRLLGFLWVIQSREQILARRREVVGAYCGHLVVAGCQPAAGSAGSFDQDLGGRSHDRPAKGCHRGAYLGGEGGDVEVGEQAVDVPGVAGPLVGAPTTRRSWMAWSFMARRALARATGTVALMPSSPVNLIGVAVSRAHR
jgi:hypothetical protein